MTLTSWRAPLFRQRVHSALPLSLPCFLSLDAAQECSERGHVSECSFRGESSGFVSVCARQRSQLRLLGCSILPGFKVPFQPIVFQCVFVFPFCLCCLLWLPVFLCLTCRITPSPLSWTFSRIFLFQTWPPSALNGHHVRFRCCAFFLILSGLSFGRGKEAQHCCENNCHNVHYWARNNLQSAVFQQTAPGKFYKIPFKTVKRRHKQQANLSAKKKTTATSLKSRSRDKDKKLLMFCKLFRRKAKLQLCVSPSLMGTKRVFHASALCVEDPSPPSTPTIDATIRRHYHRHQGDLHVSAPLCYPIHRRHRRHPSHRHYHSPNLTTHQLLLHFDIPVSNFWIHQLPGPVSLKSTAKISVYSVPAHIRQLSLHY